jgi:hypothetical protein
VPSVTNLAPFRMVEREVRTMRSVKEFTAPQKSFISRPTITSAWLMTARPKLWLSGWRDGKFMRPPTSTTAHCNVSASSTRCAMPAGVRASRSQTMTGLSAATSIFANSATAPESASGGTTLASLGMRRPSGSAIGFSCSSASSESRTGAIGGVVAIL